LIGHNPRAIHAGSVNATHWSSIRAPVEWNQRGSRMHFSRIVLFWVIPENPNRTALAPIRLQLRFNSDQYAQSRRAAARNSSKALGGETIIPAITRTGISGTPYPNCSHPASARSTLWDDHGQLFHGNRSKECAAGPFSCIPLSAIRRTMLWSMDLERDGNLIEASSVRPRHIDRCPRFALREEVSRHAPSAGVHIRDVRRF
jgi:hypothetical protein